MSGEGIVKVEVTEQLENQVTVVQNTTTVEITEELPTEVTVSLVGIQGPIGPTGPASTVTGPTGPTGMVGPTGATGPAGQGLAPGGSTGDIAVKASEADYDAGWVSMADIADEVIAAERFSHTQTVAADTWTVTHNLGRHPIVSVTDTAGTTVLGDTVHLSLNETRLVFQAPFAGTAEFI